MRKLLPRFLRHPFALLLLFLCSAGSVALTLLVPLFAGNAVDVAVENDLSSLPNIIIRLVLSAAGAALLSWCVSLLGNLIAQRTVRDLKDEACRKLNRLPLASLDRRATGEWLSRLLDDSDTVADGLLLGLSKLFIGVATVLGTFVFMLSLSPVITLAVVLLTPLSLLTAKGIAKKSTALFHAQAEAKAAEAALLDEAVGGHFTVKAFSREEAYLSRFVCADDALRTATRRAVFVSSLVNPCTRFVNSLVYAAVALLGGLLCLKGGAFTVGALTSFLSYATQYTKPFNEISGVIAELQNAVACEKRLAAFLDAPEEENGEAELAATNGDVTLNGVSFSYDKSRPFLTDLSLAVKRGGHVAIVGPTGCGKTTLVNLLMRFYDADGGIITVDGVPVCDVTRASLRRHEGMVLQETWLKTATVRENIALGKKDATESEIVAAAREAHADEFIRRLPQGYDTLLQGGNGLSQGQKQLLCLCRVLLCAPDILLLDEATSSIDTRTERFIQEAFEKLMKGRTSFIVAHRLSTVKHADLILVMQNGVVTERGTHEELLAANGFYASLWRTRTPS